MQNRTLSKTLQISHAVLFRCLKQCSACFSLKLASFLRYYVCEKTHFSEGIPWGPFVEWKTKETFCFTKRWSHYNTLIIYYCFVSAVSLRPSKTEISIWTQIAYRATSGTDFLYRLLWRVNRLSVKAYIIRTDRKEMWFIRALST